MDILVAFMIGVLYGTGVYLLLRRGFIELIFGLALIAHGANLLLFTSGGLARALPPLIPEGAAAAPPGAADPLVQALILTAIVIGFGVLSFFLILVRRTRDTLGTDDTDQIAES